MSVADDIRDDPDSDERQPMVRSLLGHRRGLHINADGCVLLGQLGCRRHTHIERISRGSGTDAYPRMLPVNTIRFTHTAGLKAAIAFTRTALAQHPGRELDTA